MELSMDISPDIVGSERESIVLVVGGGDVWITTDSTYYANGDHYHGWPNYQITIWTGDGDESIYEDGVKIPQLRNPGGGDCDDIESSVNDDERVSPLLERIVAGHESYWDGHNHCGELTDDALRAVAELIEVINETMECSSNPTEEFEWGTIEYEWVNSDRDLVEANVDPGWTCVYWQDYGGTHDDIFELDDLSHRFCPNERVEEFADLLEDLGLKLCHTTDDEFELVAIHVRDESMALATRIARAISRHDGCDNYDDFVDRLRKRYAKAVA